MSDSSEQTLDDVISAAIGGEQDSPDTEIVNDPVETVDPVEPVDAPAEKEVTKELKLSSPSTWSGFAKTKFDRLPPDVQKEISDYWGKVESQQKVYNALDETLGESKQAAMATYGSVEGMMKHYLQLDQWAANDPAGLAKWFIQQHGITPETLFGQQQAAYPQPEGEPADALMQRLQEIEKLVTNQQQGSLQAVQSEAAKKIEEFSKNPSYPFFNDLKQDMGQLMVNGQAKSLEDAYDKAMKLNPKTFETYMQSELEKQTKIKTQEAAKSKQAATIRQAGPSKVANGRSDPLDDIIQEAMAGRV